MLRLVFFQEVGYLGDHLLALKRLDYNKYQLRDAPIMIPGSIPEYENENQTALCYSVDALDRHKVSYPSKAIHSFSENQDGTYSKTDEDLVKEYVPRQNNSRRRG